MLGQINRYLKNKKMTAAKAEQDSHFQNLRDQLYNDLQSEFASFRTTEKYIQGTSKKKAEAKLFNQFKLRFLFFARPTFC